MRPRTRLGMAPIFGLTLHLLAKACRIDEDRGGDWICRPNHDRNRPLLPPPRAVKINSLVFCPS